MLPGLRFNYDQKEVDFDQQVYGGLQTTNPALIALQRSLFAPQAAPCNTGLYVGQPGDGRTVGLTLRIAFASK